MKRNSNNLENNNGQIYLELQEIYKDYIFKNLSNSLLNDSFNSKKNTNLISIEKLNKLNSEYLNNISNLLSSFFGLKNIEHNDKRFSSESWKKNPYHEFNANFFLINKKFYESFFQALNLEKTAKKKLMFMFNQAFDALAPSNFLVSNPEAQKKILETRGESLIRGIGHMLSDLKKGYVTQTNEKAFEVGKDLAVSNGSVIYQNDLIQLIQYKPLNSKIFEKPLLIIPPCINKYYILDLQPENSLVKFLLEKGHSVFIVSWKNPKNDNGFFLWDDYVEIGIIKSIQIVQEISKQQKLNLMGFCVGGTILATAIALLKKRKKNPVSSLSLLTTMLDFSEVGDIDFYIDDIQIRLLEKKVGKGGIVPGKNFSSAFSSLKANNLIWNNFESSYLKGENPETFDLLFWNSDSTNLPGPMFCYFLRNMYFNNSLIISNKLKISNQSIDLGQIQAPSFIYASKDDHIVPWKSAYESTKLINSKSRYRTKFILGASGHIAGVINPPIKNKRNYWINDKNYSTSDLWFENAKKVSGSWWKEWAIFLSKYSGKKISSPKKTGNTTYKPIEKAPGSYVKVKC